MMLLCSCSVCSFEALAFKAEVDDAADAHWFAALTVFTCA